MASYEMKEQGSFSARSAEPSDSVKERDDAALQRMGKKPVLKRNFGILSIVGFSCTVLGTWEGMLGTFAAVLANGGSGGAIYGFIFAWIGTITHFIVLGELASMAPTAGGQYHWAAMLAPTKLMKPLSFIVGWLSLCGWQAAFASSSFLAASMIQGISFVGNNAYVPQPYQATLICWAALALALFINLVGGKLLPRAETILLVIHLLGFFAILIPLVYMSEHNSKETVFLTFTNGGEFPTMGLSWFIGMSYLAFGFGGADGAVHMAEEIANAGVVIPRALMLSVGINGLLGFGMLVAILFCAGPDMGGTIGETAGFPWMGIFLESTRSVAGSQAMASIVIIIYVCAIMGLLAATSRQLWAFSRDRAVPGWRWWSQVKTSRVLPVPALLLSFTIACLLAIIRIGSDLAQEDIVSMAIGGLYTSYLVVTTMLFVRRLRGDVALYSDSDDEIVNVPGAKLVWGPFRVPGILGTVINGCAVVYLTIIVFFSYWPSVYHPTVETMNWSILAIGGAMFIAMTYYVLRARKIYTGPVVEISR